MDNYKLVNIDSEDLEDTLYLIECSFGIKFKEDELTAGLSFGKLCNLIESKLTGVNIESCTSQQAFYKLRNAIATQCQVPITSIRTDTLLLELFPVKLRRRNIKAIEKNLGFKLKVLDTYTFVSIFLALSLLGFFIGLFFNWQCIYGFLLICTLIWISNKTANQFNVVTVGDLAAKMARNNYLLSRRDQNSFNKNEVVKTVQSIFIEDHGIEVSELTPQSLFL